MTILPNLNGLHGATYQAKREEYSERPPSIAILKSCEE